MKAFIFAFIVLICSVPLWSQANVALGTPASGNLSNTTGYPGGGGGGSASVVNVTTTYQMLSTDFGFPCNVVTVSTGTFTMTVVASASQPAAGQCSFIINYGGGIVTMAASGQTIHQSLILHPGNGAMIVSDGTNYTMWGGFPSVFGSVSGSVMIAGTSNGNIVRNDLSFTTLTDGATVTWAIGSLSFTSANLTFTTHGGTRTLNITNPINGATYRLRLIQDSTGGESLSLGTGCTWNILGANSGGAGPLILTNAANAVDMLTFTYDGTNCTGTLDTGVNASYQLLDFQVVKTSSTVETINSNASATSPILGQVLNTAYRFTSPATATISGTSSTGSVNWCLLSGGTMSIYHSLAATITGSGISVNTGSSCPANSATIAITTMTSNVWDAVTPAMFYKPSLTVVPATAAGAFTTCSVVSNIPTCGIDTTQLTGPTGTKLATAHGTYTAGHVAQIDPGGSGDIIDAGDFPDVKIIPAANCFIGSAGAGWSSAANFTATCRAGSNNLGGALQVAPNAGASAQFMTELPLDWDTTNQPYIAIFYGSGANTSGTVIWTVSSACTKRDGSVSDDPAFNAESAFASQTMANANRGWAKTGQFTAITSGNSCVPGGILIIKLAVSGTASSAINAYQATLTIPRITAVQAN